MALTPTERELTNIRRELRDLNRTLSSIDKNLSLIVSALTVQHNTPKTMEPQTYLGTALEPDCVVLTRTPSTTSESPKTTS